GITGARRLMDRFQIESGTQGTIVTLTKIVPRKVPLFNPERLSHVAAELVNRPPSDPLPELRNQNSELVQTLDALRRRQEDLTQLNRELEDTNRGMVALHAELEEKADHLRRADQMKSRFLSNMTHEFRTPLNSILALARILLDRVDGPLNP